MSQLDRIRKVFASTIGPEVAENITADSTMDSTPGWDSQSFLEVVLGLEDEFGVVIKPRDAMAMFTISGIEEFLACQGD